MGLGLVLGLTVACGHQQTDSNGSAVEQALPFHADSQAFEGNGASPAVPADSKIANAAPFHSSSPAAILPAGTLLTVQLPSLLSANKVRVGDAFSAALATPFTSAGKTLVDRGTPVSGCIESVRLDNPNGFAPRGYFRLTLNSMTIAGKTVPIHTLSLYTRASAQQPGVPSQPGSMRIQKGRRLTFRLTASVTLDGFTSATAAHPVASTMASSAR
ncbi:MAG: hypothetical protein WA824_12755 [Candidatus Sulfotelmatobacter sp.]